MYQGREKTLGHQQISCRDWQQVDGSESNGRDGEEQGLLRDPTNFIGIQKSLSRPVLFITCGILLVFLLIQSAIIVFWSQKLERRPPEYSKLGLKTLSDQVRLAGVASRFWDFDELGRSNEAWDAIQGGHGIIALTPEFVAQHDLPGTIDHPKDPSRKVYAIEAYHMIHCIQWLRRGYITLKQGADDHNYPLEHVLHCFEALRQSVMCQANDELLTITGHGHARGYNQTRHCRDWDALRDFATANTACYYEEPGSEPVWDKCDDLDDGLPVENLW